MADNIVVRFAPSPTGPLHIGGVRTALFNFLFARKNHGQFILRIEDTDHERSETKFEEEIKQSMKWLGLEWDSHIIRQSERLDLYQRFSRELLAKELAYEWEGAVKLKVPREPLHFFDLVHGRVDFDGQAIDDFVIMKSNQYPTYHFASVVDDHEQGVTHVIRGDDHLPNTPKHLMLYQALGWSAPKFAHLPLVLGQDGAPLSKRHGHVSLTDYREKGFLPDGLLNYLALLGWSPGGNQEFLTREQLIDHFSIKRINKTNATFDPEKLRWLNGEHLKRLNDAVYLREGMAYLGVYAKEAVNALSKESLEDVLLLFKSRIKIWGDLMWQASFFWKEKVDFDPEAVTAHLQKQPGTKDKLTTLKERWASLKTFHDEKEVEVLLREAAGHLRIEARDLIHPARVALTGRSVSPSLFAVARLLGKEKVFNRIESAIKLAS